MQAGFDRLPLDGPCVHRPARRTDSVFRPLSLAWYIAVSAHLISVSASGPSSG